MQHATGYLLLAREHFRAAEAPSGLLSATCENVLKRHGVRPSVCLSQEQRARQQQSRAAAGLRIVGCI